MSCPIRGKITTEGERKRIIIALGGNALDNTPPEQMKAVKITAKAIVDLIEEGCGVIVAYGNGPQVGVIGNAMVVLSCGDASQPNAPLSVYVAMSQAYTGYSLQSTLGGELYNREMYGIPVVTMITQVRVDADGPTFEVPSKPIGHSMTEGQARIAEDKYDYVMKEDSGWGSRRVVASPKPAEIVEIDAIRSLVDPGRLAAACGGGGIPVTRQGNHLKGASAVIDKDFASELLAEDLSTDFLIILIVVEKVAISFGKSEERWLDDLDIEEARQCIKKGHFAPDSMLPGVQAAVKFVKPKPGHTAFITLSEKTGDGTQGEAGIHIHLA